MARRSNVLKTNTEAHTSVLGRPGIISRIGMEKAIQRFLDDCVLRNLSEHTIRYYKTELNWFKKLLEEKNVTTEPSEITLESVQDNVILYLIKTKGCKVGTVNTMLRAVTVFFRFLERKELIEENPLQDLELLRQRRTVIETFTNEQIGKLLRQPDQNTLTGVRDYTMMLLLLETGVRLRELAEIETKDIRTEDSQIMIKGKTLEDRLVPVQRTMINELNRWLTIRAKVDHDYLFINIDNEPLSRRQIQSRIKKYGRMADIQNVRCSPHTFRHTFAKMSVKNGANIFELQKVLGHSTLDMVRTYVNLFSDDIYEAHKRFSPLENLRK